ncbi:MAG: hypothetical protein SO147_08835 [Clostridia bacterium]|nr:hypothetical protein [Clostridia bacterium]
MSAAEQLKQKILTSIAPVDNGGEWHVMSGEITRETIQQALELYQRVEIPNIGKPVVLDGPVVLSSNHHLKVAREQLMLQGEGVETCLVRNEHIQNGAFHMPNGTRDRNISVQGGIWKTALGKRAYTDHEKSMRGAFGIIILCCVEQVSVTDLTVLDSSSYGVQLSDCADFTVENLHFQQHHKDGVHINGPATRGVIRNLTGEKMGDDMVALNAWDWQTSAITFGTIDHLVVEHVQSNQNELRLLPGQKVFEDGTRVDCDIRDCVLEDISGIYTFKMYAQPNIANAISGIHDVSGTVGRIEHVFVRNISFVKVTPSGLNGLPVKSLFEICADCNDIVLEDIRVNNSLQECREMDVCLVNVGPLSAVWKNGSERPEDWGEVFDPDAVCRVDRLHLNRIQFAGERVTDPGHLVRTVTMKINPDYPKTTPRGGTGYGTVGEVTVE